MPDIDGLETTRRIRRMNLTPRPFIIAVTAHAMVGDRERCLKAGMDAYIAKPLRIQELVSVIQQSRDGEKEEGVPPTPESGRERSDHAGYDFAPALQRLEGDHELLVEQMTFFLEDTPILVRDLEESLDQEENADYSRLLMAAHRLRGLSAGFDLDRLVAFAEDLETKARLSQAVENAPALCSQLRDEWENACAAMTAYVKQTDK